MQVTKNGNNLVGSLIECGKDAPALRSSFLSEWYKIDYPNELFTSGYLSSTAVDATLSSAAPGSTFALPPTALLMGAIMADPINDAWPDSASGLTQDDLDLDGKPGITVDYRNGGTYDYPLTGASLLADRADYSYIAARIVFSLNGTLTSCTQSSGSANVSHADSRIFGCNRAGSSQDCTGSEGSFLDNNDPVYQAGTATYTLVKISDTGTCADVLSALP